MLINYRIPGQWQARYAWSAGHTNDGLTVRYFRRTFTLDQKPDSFIVYVTADSRYKLWINGLPVGRGPLKGTLAHYHYEAFDINNQLKAGLNVIAAEVRWFGHDAPVSEVHSARPAFLLQGPSGMDIDTPRGWRVFTDDAVSADKTPYISNAHKFLGHMEYVDARLYPAGWMTVSYADDHWDLAVDAGPADVPDNWGEMHPVQSLYPRDIPQLIELIRRFTHITRYTGSLHQQETDSGLQVKWELAPGEAGELVLDAGALTTGYPVFSFTAGMSREIKITYSECVVSIEDRGGYRINHKAVRDDFTFGDVEGYCDTVILPDDSYIYEPFHWRTFWYVRINVGPGESNFILEDAAFRFTTYLQERRATFESSIADADKMWDISWRTLQLCAHETYEDCPYFEQLNYVADTRLQAWCSMVLAGE
ncbi:MAG: alpha-L-rhamnosidase N-terminal domain-containing protein, partial [Anaerolineae bacterium]|nr:alpha-L-rhamnosidase N-terminal domain-containing protein [Anaerolineae bacterium]